nr:translation initiation factor IF-2-like [Taeniopygia guttata]
MYYVPRSSFQQFKFTILAIDLRLSKRSPKITQKLENWGAQTHLKSSTAMFEMAVHGYYFYHSVIAPERAMYKHQCAVTNHQRIIKRSRACISRRFTYTGRHPRQWHSGVATAELRDRSTTGTAGVLPFTPARGGAVPRRPCPSAAAPAELGAAGAACPAPARPGPARQALPAARQGRSPSPAREAAGSADQRPAAAPDPQAAAGPESNFGHSEIPQCHGGDAGSSHHARFRSGSRAGPRGPGCPRASQHGERERGRPLSHPGTPTPPALRCPQRCPARSPASRPPPPPLPLCSLSPPGRSQPPRRCRRTNMADGRVRATSRGRERGRAEPRRSPAPGAAPRPARPGQRGRFSRPTAPTVASPPWQLLLACVCSLPCSAVF